MNRFAMLFASMGLLTAAGCAGDMNAPTGDQTTAQEVAGTGLSRSQLPPGEVYPNAIQFGTLTPGDSGNLCRDPGDCIANFTFCPSGIALLQGAKDPEPITFDYGVTDTELWLLNQGESLSITVNSDGSINSPFGTPLVPMTVDSGVCKDLAPANRVNVLALHSGNESANL